MGKPNSKRKLAAIFSADVKGYSKLMRDDEAATVLTLKSCQELMSGLIRQHYGRVVDSPGDNLLAEFSSVVDAVQGAVAIQKELRAKNAQEPAHRRMEFRIGINLGDIIVEGDRIYGDGVNIAARLESLAEPGGICISRTAYDQIADKLPLGYEYMGEQTAKNMEKPMYVYRVNIWPEDRKQRRKAPEPGIEQHWYQKLGAIIRKKSKSTHSAAETSKRHFSIHLKGYAGIVVFLLLINILTYHGIIWFHWPALGWGLVLFFHWLRSESLRHPRK